MTTPLNARRWINWGGNQQAIAADVLTPGTVDEVAAHVKDASGNGRKVKAVGSGHSFTAIAVANGQRMVLHRLNELISVDGDLVTVATARTHPDPRNPAKTYTTTWFDMWRIKDGKADEHWDPATIPPPQK